MLSFAHLNNMILFVVQVDKHSCIDLFYVFVFLSRINKNIILILQRTRSPEYDDYATRPIPPSFSTIPPGNLFLRGFFTLNWNYVS